MKQAFALAIIAATLVGARPANDWSKPCFQGHCAYDLPASNGQASGTIRISGSPKSIADVTPAAGWIILGCDPNALAQDIRLVCSSDNTAAAGCDHLFQDSGPVDKIVRLPESCGKNAFARISKSWVPEDQSIPASVHGQISRRDGSQPQVHVISVDPSFDAVDMSKFGTISFAIQGINIPDVDGSFTEDPARLQGRDGTDFVQKALEQFSQITFDKKTDPFPISIEKKFNVLKQDLSCPPITGTVNIDVNPKAKGTVVVGFAASGSILPPKIESFGAFAEITADLDGSVDITASLTGTVDSGKKAVVPPIAITPLEFPGIIALGPSFEVNAQAKATLTVDLALNVGLNYNIGKAQLFFPPAAGKKSGGAFQVKDTAVKLSASPSVTAKGTIEAHVIPELRLGLTGLAGKIKAGVLLEIDTSAILELTGTASGTVSKTPSATFSGCVDLKAGIDVHAGAEGSMPPIFDASTKVAIYNKQFQVLKKCFPAGAGKRTVSRFSPRSSLEAQSAGLTCPGGSVAKAVSVLTETIKSALIK